jgi:hypothetical protein
MPVPLGLREKSMMEPGRIVDGWSRIMTAKHRLAATLSLVGTLALLGACSSPAPTPSAQPSGSGSGTATTAPPPPTPSRSVQAAGTRCTSAQLSLAVTPGASAAGHVGLLIVFTNTSAGTCTMSGYPGVSFVTGPSGTQIGDAAQRVGSPVEAVSLAPQGRAHANLLLGQVGNYAADACRPTQAAGLRVYPPDETTALYVASARQVCSAAGTGFAQIYPVQAGP